MSVSMQVSLEARKVLYFNGGRAQATLFVRVEAAEVAVKRHRRLHQRGDGFRHW